MTALDVMQPSSNDCNRCGGSGIDPVRVGLPGEYPCDPDWCGECGGSGYAPRCDCGALEGTEHECDVRTVRMDTPDMMPEDPHDEVG